MTAHVPRHHAKARSAEVGGLVLEAGVIGSSLVGEDDWDSRATRIPVPHLTTIDQQREPGHSHSGSIAPNRIPAVRASMDSRNALSPTVGVVFSWVD